MKSNWSLEPFTPPIGDPVWVGASGMLGDARFDTRHLSRPCRDAAAVGTLSMALMGRSVDEKMRMAPEGAYVYLQAQASLFHRGSSDIGEFMHRLQELHAWLQRWRLAALEARDVREVECPDWALEFGRDEMEELLLGIACKKQRSITVGRSSKDSVTLEFPARAELIRATTCGEGVDQPGFEHVIVVEEFVELVNAVGLVCLVEASRVDPRIAVGTKARLVRLRRVSSVPWHKAASLERIVTKPSCRKESGHENS